MNVSKGKIVRYIGTDSIEQSTADEEKFEKMLENEIITLKHKNRDIVDIKFTKGLRCNRDEYCALILYL